MAALTPEQRQSRIAQMVEGLAARLTSDGGELAEWQRLIRSYVVLGKNDKAQESLAKARKDLASEAGSVQQLESFATALGLSKSGNETGKN